jgi:hypothetical protein
LVGELLAMYQLERHGVQVAHVDRDEHDLWVRTPSGRMLTVQVKAAAEPKRYGMAAQASYCFYVQNLAANTDVCALVALQPQVVIFCRPDEMRKRWAVELFTEERMAASIRELLA